jgi:ABC-type multidrug transport system ATPase subunit
MASLSPIVVDRLFKKFPNGYVGIKNNSFSVEAGETFGLLGPNGAGKSTTFNILTAADSKTYGTVKLLGTEVNRGVMEIFN